MGEGARGGGRGEKKKRLKMREERGEKKGKKGRNFIGTREYVGIEHAQNPDAQTHNIHAYFFSYYYFQATEMYLNNEKCYVEDLVCAHNTVHSLRSKVSLIARSGSPFLFLSFFLSHSSRFCIMKISERRTQYLCV